MKRTVLLSLAVALFAVGGLAAVIVESLVKNPRGLLEMMDDSRRFAEVRLPGQASAGAPRTAALPETAANRNEPRLVA